MLGLVVEQPLLTDNLAQVRSVIATAALRGGRDASTVELVAVSKTHRPESVQEALAAGQTLFGESRVQEARLKIPEVSSTARWHFIGRLQKNKVRHALPLFELIHSVDSLSLAEEIDRIASEQGFRPAVLLQVNVSGEGSKAGFAPDQLRSQIKDVLTLRRLEVTGLMTIPPLAPEAEDSRRYFVQLRELRDELAQTTSTSFPHLSMGMSSDFAIAVEEGATLVRVGSAIFGERPRPKRDEFD